MTPEEILSARLDDEELARIDRLAQERGVSRDAMLTALVAGGLAVCELATREAPAAPRPTDPMGEGWRSPALSTAPGTPSPWLGWAILVLVGLVVGLGGWALVRALDRRARPAATTPAVITRASASTEAEPPPPVAPPVPVTTVSMTATASASPPPVPMRREAPPARRTRRGGVSDVRDPWGYD